MIQILWQLDERSPTTGQRYRCGSRYTLSLHEKSRLSKDIEGWMNRQFTTKERADGFDLESLKGKTCQLQIIHRPGSRGGVFANVQAIIPAPRGFTMEVEQDDDSAPF